MFQKHKKAVQNKNAGDQGTVQEIKISAVGDETKLGQTQVQKSEVQEADPEADSTEIQKSLALTEPMAAAGRLTRGLNYRLD